MNDVIPAPRAVKGPMRCGVELDAETTLWAAPGTEHHGALAAPPRSAPRSVCRCDQGRRTPATPYGCSSTTPWSRRRTNCGVVVNWGIEIRGGGAAGVFWVRRRCVDSSAPTPSAAPPSGRGGRTESRTRSSRTPLWFPWRGLMLDVSRHFMPKDGVLRHLDLMAAHKLNVFHFHLTDDQGWRVQIKRYPKLTEVGSWRARTKFGHRASPLWEGEAARGLLHAGRHPRDRRVRGRAAYRCRPRDRHPGALAGRHRRVSGTGQHRRHRHDLPDRLGHRASPKTYSPPLTTPCASTRGCSRNSGSSSRRTPVRSRGSRVWRRSRRLCTSAATSAPRTSGSDRPPRRRASGNWACWTRTSCSPGSSGTSTTGSPRAGVG